MVNVVGIYVRQAGVWERANAGTPIGFSGPQVRQAGAWENTVQDYAYVPGWATVWVNIDNEIGLGNLLLTSFDFSPPPSAQAQYWLNPDGTIDGQVVPGTPASRTKIADWRAVDCGREYQVLFDEILSGSFVAWDTTPTLDTWLELTDPDNTYTYIHESASQASRENRLTVKIREKVTAPVGGNDFGNHDTFLDNDTL